MKIVKLLRTILLFALIRPGRSQCSVNLQEHLGPLEPLFIKDGQLWAPDGPALTWEAHESTIVACSKVKFINASNNTAYLTCVSGQDFLVDETPLNSVELQCSGRMTGEVDDTGEQCGSNGTLLKLGFDVESVGFVTYIESCYDRPDASVIFTKHIIPGKAIAHSIKESYRPAFKVAGTSLHVNPATSYTQKAQMDRLTELLGSEIQAKKFLQGGSYYLARGHLAPDADGVYRSWQWATFFYVNVAPQWQVINAGNWLVVENLSRSKAGQLQEDLVVYDGVHDVLLLPHADGQSIPITLEAAGIRVPKWYWKIIISPVASAGIAFITNNDPFRVDMPDNELLCEDVCQQYGWNEVRFKNFTRGYTYCCTVDGLREAINDIPREFQVNYVLHKREE
ncbi:uncharacterized protein LOC134220073 isoform X1 [Armigeres subalbatus]|uniref:uncharacterized protein LOC134220073 isoform X1 n=1 Tax=Armigeres subalbatus TaxID=124917 RepID=UPI002ECFBFBC